MPDYNTRRREQKKKVEEIVVEEPITQDDYFLRVSVFHYFCVIVGFVMFWFVCFWEDVSIFKKLAGPGQRLLYLRENYMFEMRLFFYVAILLHLIEAFYAFKICKEMYFAKEVRFKWVAQTAIVGYSSLRHLISHRGKKEEERKSKKK